VGVADGAGADEHLAFGAGLAGVAAAGSGGDGNDRQEPAVAEQLDEVGAAEGAVVDDADRPGQQGSEASDALERGLGFAADVGDRGDGEDHAGVALLVAGGDHDVLGAPGGLTAAGDMEGGVGVVAERAELAGCLVEPGVAGLGLPERGDDLAVGVQHPGEVGMGGRSRSCRVAQAEVVDGLAGGDLFESGLEFDATEGACWGCGGLDPERACCDECAGSGRGTMNPRVKWDWYRILEEGTLASVLAEIRDSYGDEESPRVHTWALVVDGEWRDCYDEVPTEPIDLYTDRLEASLSDWIDRWERVVASRPPDAPAAFVLITSEPASAERVPPAHLPCAPFLRGAWRPGTDPGLWRAVPPRATRRVAGPTRRVMVW